jgi:hypothetical protein
MCCVNKKDVSFSRLCRLQFRRQLFLQKVGLNGDVLFETFLGAPESRGRVATSARCVSENAAPEMADA